jgi:O-antigen ligase
VPALVKQWQPWLLSVLVALMPLSLSIDQRIKTLPTALLFIAGVCLITRYADVRRSYRAAAPVVLMALLVVAYVAFNVIVHQLGWRPMDRPAHVLLYLAIAAAFSQPLRLRLVWAGFSLTAATLGVACMVQHFHQGIERAYGLNGGPSASAELAMVLLGLALMALLQVLSARTQLLEKGLHALAMVLGMYGALLTQSRGPLLAFVPVFALLALLQIWGSRQWRLGAVLLLGIGVGAGLAALSLNGVVTQRFEAIGQEVATFDPQSDARGAIRERLEMWRTAGRALVEHPFVGVGIDRFSEYARAEIAAGRSNLAIAPYNQPHNEYLEAAATGGVPGLLVLVLIFALPLRYFVRHLRDPDEAIALPAAGGAALVLLYVLCALTDSVFYRVMSQSFYFFLVLGMAVRVGRGARGGAPRAGQAFR